MKKIYIVIICFLFTVVLSRYFYLYAFSHKKYSEEYLEMTNKIVYGLNSPRGRILDRNGNVLVDNVGVNTIVFYKKKDVNTLDVAKEILSIIDDVEEASVDEQIEFYLDNNDSDFLLSDDEISLFNDRKISLEEVEDLKKERVIDYLDYSSDEKKVIYLDSLLNKGYSYDFKVILKDISDDECAKINELGTNGLTCEYTTKRVYLYDTLNELYGSVGSIPSSLKDEYLDKGYNLNDEVGLSYLEKEYDEYLKGEKAKYLVNDEGDLVLISPSKQGNDIYLSIDITLQEKINKVIKKYLDKKDNYLNTKYYNRSYVIVSDPNTGEIIASSGIAKINDSYIDVTKDILTNSFTVGSVVKGASMTVGYQNDLIEVGKKINDSCVKLYQVPMKCSYKRLGYIDDITALKTSSNYYQFLLAIKLTNSKYKYNMKLDVSEEHFEIYRDTFASFGLGSSTGIDLDNESLGITGSKVAADLLLNLSIGQYDTYTPLQLTNYINTIATSGKRYSLHYLKEVKNGNELVYSYESNLLNEVNNSNFERIKEGFRQVLYIGTGRGYTDLKYKPAGKTGTSEVVYSSDVTTINQSYIMYAPYDNPKYTITVISPNISYNNDKNNYIAPINRYISKEVSEIVFSN